MVFGTVSAVSDRWVLIGSLRVDSGSVVITASSFAGHENMASAVDRGTAVSSPIGVDLRPLTGLPGVLVPSGHGDGIYPVYARLVVDTGGEERVAEVAVRFIE